MSFAKLTLAGAAALIAGLSSTASAQERYIGEIFMMGSNFCPRGSANADGQLLPIAQNTALFSLFGTFYGGDGRTTFALPDLRGRSPIHAGQGPGLNNYQQGQKGGRETVTLTVAQLPNHTHEGIGPVRDGNGEGKIDVEGDGVDIAPDTGATGGSQAVNIRDPFTVIRYCVALNGIYPSRN
jgi:microcystin-dependent protein